MTDGPILVTGAGGYIASWVVRRLLERGEAVRGTVRRPDQGEALRNALVHHGVDARNLSITVADLADPGVWPSAVAGCGGVVHLASPFPIAQPRGRESLVSQAREGTLRVVDAAVESGIRRIVVTSSMVAMAYRAGRSSDHVVREGDWTDPGWNRLSAYIVSKTRAELALWNYARDRGVEQRLSVVNPGFVLGPGLLGRVGTSLDVIRLLLAGAYPALPKIAFAVVDVRDLADIHVRALVDGAARGRRLLAAGSTMTMQEIGRTLREALPEHSDRVPTRLLPDGLIRFLSLFDRRMRTILPDLGVSTRADSDYVTELTGVRFRDPAESVVDAARFLLDSGLA